MGTKGGTSAKDIACATFEFVVIPLKEGAEMRNVNISRVQTPFRTAPMRAFIEEALF